MTVDTGFGGDVFHVQQFGESGKHVGVIDQGICLRSRRDPARPASDEGNAMTAFFRTGLSSGEWAVCPVAVLLDVSLGPESAVVAGEEHERVVFHSAFLERLQHAADFMIKLCDVVAVRTGPALASELLFGQPRSMRFQHRVVEKQRFRIVFRQSDSG